MNYIKLILLINILFASNANIWNNKLLFCLNKNEDVLNINYKNNDIKTNHEDLNTILEKFNVLELSPWLPGATNNDIDGEISLNKIYKLQFEEKTFINLKKLKEEIEQLPYMHSSEYEYKRKPLYTPNDQYYNNQWFLPAINANDAWNLWTNFGNTPGDRDVILASIDLGVNYSHPDLRNNLWQNLGEDADGDGRTIEGSGSNWYLDPGDLNGIDDDDWDDNPNTYIDDLIGWDPSGLGGVDDNDPNPPSSNGWSHGTHVAGLLAATTDNNTGIASTAFNCSIMSVKVSDENQSGQVYITDGYPGVLYAAKAGYYSKGFSVLNNSWGGSGYSQYEQATINTCYNNYNTIIVCAAGNGSTTGWGESDESHYPSGYDNVVSVCAMGQNNQWNHWATYGETVDLASPGEGIRSTTINSYQSWDGSSMASPVAASVFGLLKSYQPNWNNEMIETMVLATADPVIYQVNTENYLQGMLGHGRVDAYQALITPLFPKIEYVGEDLIAGNDNIINPGEEVELFIILFNNPEWGNADNVIANLTTNNSNITILNPTINYGDINVGEAMVTEPFILSIDDNINPSEVQFVLDITSNQNGYVEYNTSIELTYLIEENNTLLGDINQDTLLNILDIVMLVNIIIDSNNSGNDAADMNQDGLINILDVVLLVNLIIEI